MSEKEYYSPELKRVFKESEAEKVSTPLGIQWRVSGKVVSHFSKEAFMGKKPIAMPQELYEEGRKAFRLKEAGTSIIPWEMTAEEFMKEGKEVLGKTIDFSTHPKFAKEFEDYYRKWHREWVESAIKDGEYIPDKVLKDYPELREKYSEHFKDNHLEP